MRDALRPNRMQEAEDVEISAECMAAAKTLQAHIAAANSEHALAVLVRARRVTAVEFCTCIIIVE
jgi:hypothetical protein